MVYDTYAVWNQRQSEAEVGGAGYGVWLWAESVVYEVMCWSDRVVEVASGCCFYRHLILVCSNSNKTHWRYCNNIEFITCLYRTSIHKENHKSGRWGDLHMKVSYMNTWANGNWLSNDLYMYEDSFFASQLISISLQMLTTTWERTASWQRTKVCPNESYSEVPVYTCVW